VLPKHFPPIRKTAIIAIYSVTAIVNTANGGQGYVHPSMLPPRVTNCS